MKKRLSYFDYLWAWRNGIVTVFVPLILLPLLFCFESSPDLIKPMRCAYVIAIMVIFWSCESLPIAITALLPMLLYPLLQIEKADTLAPKYMDETNMAFLTSIMVITAFENAGLHKRFALAVLKILGIQQRWMLLGFMIVSWFLSMWMQNTMTTALLTPIVLEVSQELSTAIALKRQESAKRLQDFVAEGGENIKDAYADNESIQDVNRKYKTMLLISVAYSSSIGGVATLLGTSPNLMMKQQVDEAYQEKGCTSPLNFLSWMVFGLPASVIFLVIGWLWMSTWFCGPLYTFGCRPSPLDEHKRHVEQVIARMYSSLPPLGFRQWVVLANVVAMVALMLTRMLFNDPIIGWEVIAPGYVKESTASVLIVFILFIFPISSPKKNEKGKLTCPKTPLTWGETEKLIPFAVVLLIGGGMAAASGAVSSGLADILAALLDDMTASMSDTLAVFIISVFIVFVTEVMSNTACVVLMMPILRQLAELRGSNPLYFMFPASISSSFAFMFPVATPPNSIVFSAGKLRVIDMISAGFFMNLFGIGVVTLATTTYGNAYFDFTKMPWQLENGTNNTYICL